MDPDPPARMTPDNRQLGELLQVRYIGIPAQQFDELDAITECIHGKRSSHTTAASRPPGLCDLAVPVLTHWIVGRLIGGGRVPVEGDLRIDSALAYLPLNQVIVKCNH
ncbi:hypothetical protein AB0M34_21990 [Nocardia sp. NPDC050193]